MLGGLWAVLGFEGMVGGERRKGEGGRGKDEGKGKEGKGYGTC